MYLFRAFYLFIVFVLCTSFATASFDDKSLFHEFDLKTPSEISKEPFRSASVASFDSLDVIVFLKDPVEVSSWEGVSSFDENKIRELEALMKRFVIDDINLFSLRHEFKLFNGFAGSVDYTSYTRLSNHPFVKDVFIDEEVSKLLQDSVDFQGVDDFWDFELGGKPIKGEGQSVCVIDTGVDYTHPDLGGCSSFYSKEVQEEVLSESITSPNYPSNYSNNLEEVYYLSVHGADFVSIFFSDFATEEWFDRVSLYDSNDELIKFYSGNLGSFESIKVPGDTVKIVFTSDHMVTDRGFNITSINGFFVDYECDKVIGGHDFAYDSFDPFDVDGHGTHVSGIVAASGGISGVAPSASIVGVKSLNNEGKGLQSDIIAGISYCISNADRFNISSISMSLGGSNSSDFCNNSPFRSSIDLAVFNNISVVAATGNDGIVGAVSSPACVESAIRVGSVDKSGSISSFSNRWPSDMLFAIGSNVNSTVVDGGYGPKWGTSMATPHVSGVIALLNQYLDILNVSMSPYEINEFLKNTGDEILDGDTSHKKINASRALSTLVVEHKNLSHSLSLSLNVSNEKIELFNGSLNVSWGVNSLADFNSSLKIFDPSKEIIFSSNNSSSSIFLNSSSPNSLLNASGGYKVVLNSSNEFFNESFIDSFFVKKRPDFDLLINGSNTSYSEGNLGYYNLSLEIVDANTSGLSLFIDDVFVSFENASNFLFSNPGVYVLTLNHSASDNYFEDSVVKFMNLSDFYLEQIVLFDNITFNSLNNLSINISDYFNFEGFNLSASFTNTSLNQSFNDSSLLVLSSTPAGSYSTNVNVSVDTFNDTLSLLSNDFFISVSDITFEKNISNFFVFSSENLSINFSDFFLFGKKSPVFNVSSSFDFFFKDDEELVIITNKSGTYSMQINASLNSSFAKSNVFNVSVRDPFLYFNYSNNISDVSFLSGSSVDINLSNHFSFGGGSPSFELIGDDVSFNLDGDILTLNHDTSGSYVVGVNASLFLLNASSNTFLVDVREDTSRTASSGGTTSGGVSAPPPVLEDDVDSFVEDNVSSSEFVENKSFVGISFSKKGLLPGDITEVEDFSDSSLRDFDGFIYRAFKFNKSNESGYLDVEFNVSKSWLSSNNLSSDDVFLFYKNSPWRSASTELTGVFDDVYVFESRPYVSEVYVIGSAVIFEAESVFVQRALGEEEFDSGRDMGLFFVLFHIFISLFVFGVSLFYILRKD